MVSPASISVATPGSKLNGTSATAPSQGLALRERGAWWVLCLGATACYVGHGAFGVIGKLDWLPFFALVGIGPAVAWWLMLLVGVVDIAAGLSVAVYPTRLALAYMTVWAVWTASLRPLTGLSFWEMIERAGNYGVPLALLVWTWNGTRINWLERLSPRRLGGSAPYVRGVLAVTTGLLLIGHGALAFEGKPLLDKHLLLFDLPPVALAAQGWIEVTLGIACLLMRSPGVLLVAFVWKVATESLWLAAGAWPWEFVERGGSYAAPLALALVVGSTFFRRPTGQTPAWETERSRA